MRNSGPFASAWVHVALVLGIVLIVTRPATRACATGRPPSDQPLGAPPVSAQRPQPPRAGQTRPQKPAPGATIVTGRERIEWEQTGPSFEQINGYHYVAIVGLARKEMDGVKCEARAPKGPFVCSALLPPLDSGNHQVRVMALRREGGRELAGASSRPLLLFKQ